MSDEWDFGFTAVDDIPATATEPTQPVVAQVDDEQLQALMDKMERLESLIISADDTEMINEHRQLVQQDVVTKLKQVEDLILPLLFNLQKNPEKDYIHWPNRAEVIEAQLKKIVQITRGK